MRRFSIILVCLLMIGVAIGLCSTALAEEDPVVAGEVAEAAPVARSGPSLAQTVWAFLNAPAGLTMMASVVAFVLGKIFLTKPKWKVLAEKYKPAFISAVKFAEKAIPDDAENKGLQRCDEALAWILKLEPKLKTEDRQAVLGAITAVHAEAEAGKNI